MIEEGLNVKNAEEGEYYFFLFPSDFHVVTDNLLCQLISALSEHLTNTDTQRRRSRCTACASTSSLEGEQPETSLKKRLFSDAEGMHHWSLG